METEVAAGAGSTGRGRVGRTLALVMTAVAALAAGLRGLQWLAAPARAGVGAPGPAAFDDLATVAAAVAAGAVLLWLCTGVVLCALAELLRTRARGGTRLDALVRATAPALLQRWVASLLGAGVVGAGALGVGAAPALAAPLDLHRAQTPALVRVLELPDVDRPIDAGRALPDLDRPIARQPAAQDAGGAGTGAGGGALPASWTPDRPAAPARVVRQPPVHLVASAPGAAAALDREDVVPVRPGDTLWTLAARHLGPGATAAEVADAWPRWWSANRDVIGGDPDLLLPGQLLRPPP